MPQITLVDCTEALQPGTESARALFCEFGDAWGPEGRYLSFFTLLFREGLWNSIF